MLNQTAEEVNPFMEIPLKSTAVLQEMPSSGFIHTSNGNA
jgi:hypothetical protein